MSGRSIIEFSPKRALLLEAAKRGLPKNRAAALAGVSRTALYSVLVKGEAQRTGKYRLFYDEYKQAEAQGISDLLNRIDTAADKQWQAAAWLLERCHPDEFARPETRIAINEKGNDEETGKQSQVIVYIPDNGRD